MFETPELPAAKRVELYDYLEKVRSEIHRDAARRLYRSPVAKALAGRLAASKTFRNVFYQSFFVRSTVDRVRYGCEGSTPPRPACERFDQAACSRWAGR